MVKHTLIIILCFMITACANQVSSTPASISTPTNAPSLGDHFPQLVPPLNVYLDTPLIEGDLVLENGCLRVNGVQNLLTGNNLLLVWDSRFSTQSEKGVVQVVDSRTGEVLVSVDDYVAIGDGGDNIKPTNKPIPDECPGPYWIVG